LNPSRGGRVSDKRGLRSVERQLRAQRPEPSDELMRSIVPRRQQRRQLAFAGALTAALAVALSAVGGASYAATSLTHAAKAAVKLVVPRSHHGVVVVHGLTAGGDQYRPGYGWGDKNHEHSGPPGLKRGKPGDKTSRAQVEHSGKAVVVSTTLTVDEQAGLYFSVLDASGKQLMLSQKGSKIGTSAGGPQTKTIHYVLLVPRTIPLTLRIPGDRLVPGHTYTIRVIAVDAEGNKSSTRIPFTA
jgi:hypothetical protein